MAEPFERQTTGKAPATGAERVRRLRERRKGGLRVWPVEASEDLLDQLIERGDLDPQSRDDQHEVSRVLGELLEIHVFG
jgi:hypothetical protein